MKENHIEEGRKKEKMCSEMLDDLIVHREICGEKKNWTHGSLPMEGPWTPLSWCRYVTQPYPRSYLLHFFLRTQQVHTFHTLTLCFQSARHPLCAYLVSYHRYKNIIFT